MTDMLRPVGMRYTPLTKKALTICFSAHKDQLDKSGLPYVFHPFHLAEQMDSEAEICTALLHDTVEDSAYTLEDLEQEGFPPAVLEALKLLTHIKSVPYMEYVAALRKNPIARKVKLADLAHNSIPERLSVLTDKDRRRMKKYAIARRVLEDDPFEPETGRFCKKFSLTETCFLSVFYRPGTGAEAFALSDSPEKDGCSLTPEEAETLRQKLDPGRSLPEGLAIFAEEHSFSELAEILHKTGISGPV